MNAWRMYWTVRTHMRDIGRRFIQSLGWQVDVNDYLNAPVTVERARRAGLTVCEYLEQEWDQVGVRDAVVAQMQAAGCLAGVRQVCEIGPGTGMFTESVMRLAQPQEYSVFETEPAWASWLHRTYAVRTWPASGASLTPLRDGSVDLIHAHGVFVYLRPLVAFEYFREMCRTCRAGGWIVFDFFPADEFGLPQIDTWLNTPNRYPIPLDRHSVLGYFAGQGYDLVGTFSSVVGPGRSTYLLLNRPVHS